MPTSSRSLGLARSIGLDIGSQSLKYVLLRRGATRLEIEIAGAVELGTDVVSDGVVVDPAAFARALRRQMPIDEIGNTPLGFSIPSHLATLRWLSMPQLSAAELRDAAKYKVKRHLPFPVDQAYLEVSQPPTDVPGPTASLVIAVRKDVVDSRAEAISRAGLNPVRAELEAQSLLRVIERRQKGRSVLWRDASLTIIDVGGNNTHMYVVQNQQLQFIRGVNFGGAMFAEAIAGALSISAHEAGELLGNPQSQLSLTGVLCVPTEGGAAIVDLSLHLNKLIREFSRLIRYFRSLHPERSYAGILDQVIVCGGLVGLSGFDKFLANELGLRVELVRPIAGMLARFDLDAFASLSGKQEVFAVATGLALAGLNELEGRREGDTTTEFAWARAL